MFADLRCFTSNIVLCCTSTIKRTMTSVRERFLLLIIQDFMSLYIIIQGFTRTCFITCLYLEYYFWFRNQNHSSVLRRVFNFGSDTFGNPIFRRSYKISNPRSRDALPSFTTILWNAKIGLSKWIFYVKNHLNLSDFFFIEEYEFRNTFFVIDIFW